MKVKKHEWKYKGYNIFRVMVNGVEQYKVMSYAGDLKKPVYFYKLWQAKQFIDNNLLGVFGGVF